jgi:hypothetical protein
MKADVLLSRLEKVKRTGNGVWMARCPAHDDKNPSMSVRELDDGKVLVRCHAECSVEQILGAVGLDFDALFPEKIDHRSPPVRRPYPAADVLEALSRETLIVAVAAGNLAQGVELTDVDRARLLLAASRIEQARSMANGDR